eukprot:TRINITY_DN1482_c0_g1_i1.p1 TRINITY_DN1482_c0_g1~~TRINITY_DN1482_c0_g1_i1.p1  ORF type:complete len:167 (-),score=6.00 TRINITY_DN1482_c0_g1_i1:256-756(-)
MTLDQTYRSFSSLMSFPPFRSFFSRHMDAANEEMKLRVTKQVELHNTSRRGLTSLLEEAKNELKHIKEVNVGVRCHFNVSERALETFSKQHRNINKSQFHDLVYDTNDFSLLKQNYWLLLRLKDTEEFWRLRHVERRGNNLIWEETSDRTSILLILKAILNCSKES